VKWICPLPKSLPLRPRACMSTDLHPTAAVRLPARQQVGENTENRACWLRWATVLASGRDLRLSWPKLATIKCGSAGKQSSWTRTNADKGYVVCSCGRDARACHCWQPRDWAWPVHVQQSCHLLLATRCAHRSVTYILRRTWHHSVNCFPNCRPADSSAAGTLTALLNCKNAKKTTAVKTRAVIVTQQ